MTRIRPLLQTTVLALGLAVVAYLLWRTGWAAVQANLAAIGGWFLALVALYAVAQLGFARGWWCVMPGGPPVPFSEVFAVYLAGDSVNYASPAGVAGEPVKVHLLRGALSPGETVASLVLHRHAEVLAQTVFVAAGVTVALVRFPMAAGARLAALGGVALLLIFLGLMSWGFARGSFGPIVGALARLPLLGRVRKLRTAADNLDARLQGFYVGNVAEGRRRLVAASAWCLVGWCGGLVETYVVLKLFDRSYGWDLAVAVEALTIALNNAFLWVPGRVGSAEGVRTGVCVLLGLPAAQGVAYGLVRRARELVWVVPGVLVLFKRHVEWPWKARPAAEKVAGEGAVEW